MSFQEKRSSNQLFGFRIRMQSSLVYLIVAVGAFGLSEGTVFVPEFSSSAVDVDVTNREKAPCNSMCRDKQHEECFTGMDDIPLVKPYTKACSRVSSGSGSYQASAIANGKSAFGVQAKIDKSIVDVTITISKEAKEIRFHSMNNLLHAKIFVEEKNGQASFYELKISTPSPQVAKCFQIQAIKPFNAKFPYALHFMYDGSCH